MISFFKENDIISYIISCPPKAGIDFAAAYALAGGINVPGVGIEPTSYPL